MLKKLLNAIKRDGLGGFIVYAAGRIHLKRNLIRIMTGPVAIPTAAFLLMMARWYRVRFILLFSNRIGHYPYNTELIQCVLEKQIKKTKVKNVYYTVPGAPICNQQIHRMWQRVITILPLPHLIAEIDRYMLLWSEPYRNDPIKKFFMPKGHSWDAWNLLGNTTEPHVYFTSEEETRGKKLLKEMGIPEGAQFICLLGRDSRYLSVYMPKHDLSYTNYRNVDIATYEPAANYLAEQGYYVIRMGRFVEKKFNAKHPNIIDYADSEFCSDFADIYLSAKCYFFISVSCGLDAVAQLFRRPILQTNVPFVDPDFHPEWYLFIPKKIIDLKTNRVLTQNEITKIFPWVNSNGAREILKILANHNLKQIENTPEEITAAVQEMLAILNKKISYSTSDDQLQNQFWKNFKDPGMRLLSSKAPNICVTPLKIPVFEGDNLIFNREAAKVRLRIGTAYLKYNAIWLIGETVITDSVMA